AGAAARARALGGAVPPAAVAPRVTHAAPDVCDRLPHAMVGGIDLSGRWHADGEDVVVTHVGASVTGIAVYDEGGTATYTGCFDGHTFYMEYTNAVDDGYAELVLSADGATLHGYWYSYEDDGRHHDWTLTRVR